tara:strand:- start:3203 stop:3355 length:153 start_codon:yes stop_codon:yes gene_type:complete
MTTNDQTTAQQLQFQLEFMGYMAIAGREEQRDNAYVKAQALAQTLIDQGH